MEWNRKIVARGWLGLFGGLLKGVGQRCTACLTAGNLDGELTVLDIDFATRKCGGL